MLPLVRTGRKKIGDYNNFLTGSETRKIKEIAKKLSGKKIFMVNATPKGGGVAEILSSLVPLMKGLGIDARWYVIPGDDNIFSITKKIHISLQDNSHFLSATDKKKYLSYQKKIAKLMSDMRPDFWLIHDPQPAGAISFLKTKTPSVLRMHIDTSNPNKETWRFLGQFFPFYKKIVFSSKKYVRGTAAKKSVFFTPAIDPLSDKNVPIGLKESKKIITEVDKNIRRPLVSQVSRFDIFKDPLGVIKAYKLAKKSVPNLQLLLVGFFVALDDPDAIKIYKAVKRESAGDKNIFIFSNPRKLGKIKMADFVKAVQEYSNIIIQNSKREGFGLTVSEALWKEKAVIGGTAEGIKIQIKDGYNGYLANSYIDLSKKIVSLIEDNKKMALFGKRGHFTVKKKFLITRLLIDYLSLIEKIIYS